MNRTWILFPIALLVSTCLVVWNHWTMDRKVPVFTPVAKLADFTENFVHCTVTLEKDDQSDPILCATFSPTEAGFHLYGKDLPAEGVGGFGVPTRLDIPPQTTFTPLGALSSDVAAHELRIDQAKVQLPIYPEGEVTLRQRVQLTPTDGGFSARCTVSYMSCQTNGVCRFPVKQRVVQLEIPRGI